MIGKKTSSSSPMGTPSTHGDHQVCSKDPERLLPIANVTRLMKKTLPTNAKISKEAKETVQECVSEFISFITGEASDKCLREKRKTINGNDLLWAMTTLGFENYVDPLKKYLSKFRELEEDKTNIARHDHKDSTNDHQQRQVNSMNGHLGIGKAVNFGDFDQAVNFVGGNNQRLNGVDNGSVNADGVVLYSGLQW